MSTTSQKLEDAQEARSIMIGLIQSLNDEISDLHQDILTRRGMQRLYGVRIEEMDERIDRLKAQLKAEESGANSDD